MASHPQPSPPTALHPPHHGPSSAAAAAAAAPVNGPMPLDRNAAPPPPPKTAAQHLQAMNEAVWLQIGSLTELMGDLDGAIQAYEHALRHNWRSIQAMNAISCILRTKEHFHQAVEYLQNILKIDATNGEVWGSLGHCFLMMDDLQQAYTAYQQAVYHLRDPKDPKLWYGIGILYDRFGSLELAEEAFSQVMRMQPDFEKANEIYFRLGIIYKQQTKYQQSFECFRYIINDPPRPLTEEDIWFQIGHVHEQQKDYDLAKAAYRSVLDRDPNHAKVLQQLGWLHHQQSNNFNSQEQAIEYLEKSVASDQSDAQSWYLLGRCYMSQQKYPKAYEAYQQAVYRDGRNSTFWCSIGVLYYQINQYRDALDAYSRAIRLNPYISEVWYDLGTLYESCNNQISDAMDAYTRAAELDPSNVHIKARLQLLRNGRATGMPNQNLAPLPQDVHPQAYQPPGVAGPPRPQWGVPQPTHPPPNPPHMNPASSTDWGHRLAEIQHAPPPPPPPVPAPPSNPYDPKEGMRSAPPPPPPPPSGLTGPPRPISPRIESLRHYQEPPRTTHGPAPAPVPPRRPISPSPRVIHALPAKYPPPPPPPPPPPSLAPHAGPPSSLPQLPVRTTGLPPTSSSAAAAPNRIANPNYGAPTMNPLPPAGHTTNGVAPPLGPMPPYGRGHSPPPEMRSMVEDRAPPSPSVAHHRPGYPSIPPPHLAPSPSGTAGGGGIAGGAPAPEAALAAAEAAARDRHDRTPSMPMKRRLDWPDDPPSAKKLASDENRMSTSLEDHHHRRPSPSNRLPSPHDFHARAVDDVGPSSAAPTPHPSSARPPPEEGHHSMHAHRHHHHASDGNGPPHPHALPPLNPSSYGRGMSAGPPKDEPPRREDHEPAARQMDVDEDYDDGEGDGGSPARNHNLSAGLTNGVAAKVEA